MTKAVIQGTYADIKNVKTRSVVQIVIEVPIEQAGLIQQALGWPQPGSEIRVAVARLHDGAADTTQPAGPTSEPAAPSPRTLDDMPYPQQAALLCKMEPFQAWLKRGYKQIFLIPRPGGTDEERAAYVVRRVCGDIESRRELQPDTPAGNDWKRLYQTYKSEVPF